MQASISRQRGSASGARLLRPTENIACPWLRPQLHAAALLEAASI